MIQIAALGVIVVTVYAVLKRAEVRLTLILAALALGCLAGRPVVIVQTFLDTFTREQFLLPIGCCMGFAYVLRDTGCDQHLVHLLLRPLQGFRTLLIPGVVLIGALVNVPIISQSSTAIAVGSVLVPVMSAAGLSPTTTGAALILGCSIGGELLNPGAPELRTVSEACGVPSVNCIDRVWPLLLVHLGVATPLFWFLAHRAEKRLTSENPATDLTVEHRIHYLKAMVPLLPLLLLFVTAMPPRFRLFTVPEAWLVSPGTRGSFDSRLIGAAMLIGVVAAGLLNPDKVPRTAKVFFEGAGHALTNVVALIVAAACFGKGVEVVGLAAPLERAIEHYPRLLIPLAALLPLSFGWISGSGMASTQSLFGFFVEPAHQAAMDPLLVGAVVSLSAAAGRTLSPVSAVVLMTASLTGGDPPAMLRRIGLPLLLGLMAVMMTAMLLG